jgi:hypothetical protein
MTSRSPDPACLQASAVLAADAPQALAAFYGALLEQPAQPGMGPQHWRVLLPSGVWLEIYRPSRSRPQARQRGRLSLCLRRAGALPELEAWIEQAVALGGQVLDGPRHEPFGAEAWLLDPEGNALLLLVSGP